MRKLVLSMFISLDGYIEGPQKSFVDPPWSPDMDAWTQGLQAEGDCLVFGSTCWSQLAAYWPQAEVAPISPAEHDLALYMNRVPKVVFSNSLTDTEAWSASTLVRESPASYLAALKRTSGKNIMVLGGAALAASVMEADLVDEYKLLVVPTLYGGGTRLFSEGRPQTSLTLLENRSLDTGAVLLRYARK